jgi:RNA polymerase sigma-70 factor, ECF subfamily
MKTMPHGVRAQRQPVVEKTVGNGKSLNGKSAIKRLDPEPSSAVALAIPPEVVPPTDEQLLMAYRTGDRASFTELMGRYQRELFHFLVRFLGDRAAAEDIFQETFLQIHQSAQDFDTQRRFRPWLFTIAANKARDLMRSNARRPTSPLQATINKGQEESGDFLELMTSSVELPDQPMQQKELQSKVKQTVESMPENLREILLLSYFHQFPYKQISSILDIPLGTVKSRLHAAVAHFANQWRASNPGQSMS